MPRKTSIKSDRRAVRAHDVGISDLEGMTVGALQETWKKVYGESTRSRNKAYLRKKIQFRIQELSEGGLSKLAKAKANDLVQEHATTETQRRESRKRFAAFQPPRADMPRDPRLPAAGTCLKRDYKGKTYQILVHEGDFEYAAKRYSSLSTVAKEITGQIWNGFLFFHLTEKSKP